MRVFVQIGGGFAGANGLSACGRSGKGVLGNFESLRREEIGFVRSLLRKGGLKFKISREKRVKTCEKLRKTAEKGWKVVKNLEICGNFRKMCNF